MDAPLDVVVRFSTSQSDLVISVKDAATTTGIALKQLIRADLPSPANSSRLRLISAGKVLPDNVPLSKSVNAARAPPPRDDESKSEKAKGKQAVRDVKPVYARVYVHCSIGDVLSAAELAAEAKQAQEADAALQSSQTFTTRSGDLTSEDVASTTTLAPRGFDRLIGAGFTQAEVATLRTQFLAIQAHTHTPDTMPTGTQLLELEERWLDNSSNPATDSQDTGGFGSEDAGSLEDMLWGNLIGFFWPIGAMCYMREEGIWTRRRQVAVLSGFLVNLTFGFLRLMN